MISRILLLHLLCLSIYAQVEEWSFDPAKSWCQEECDTKSLRISVTVNDACACVTNDSPLNANNQLEEWDKKYKKVQENCTVEYTSLDKQQDCMLVQRFPLIQQLLEWIIQEGHMMHIPKEFQRPGTMHWMDFKQIKSVDVWMKLHHKPSSATLHSTASPSELLASSSYSQHSLFPLIVIFINLFIIAYSMFGNL